MTLIIWSVLLLAAGWTLGVAWERQRSNDEWAQAWEEYYDAKVFDERKPDKADRVLEFYDKCVKRDEPYDQEQEDVSSPFGPVQKWGPHLVPRPQLKRTSVPYLSVVDDSELALGSE